MTKYTILGNKTTPMRILICLVVFVAGISLSCNHSENLKPNIILILTDDQGSVDANVYGASDLYTPSIDRLAGEGLMFSRFYTASAICSPSRAAILTGLTPHSAEVPGNVSSIPGNPGMPGEKFTIAEAMKENDYVTGHVGKWHLGYTKETGPLNQGFDYSFGHKGGCIDNYSHFFYWNGPNRHDLWENGIEIFEDGKYFPDLMAGRAEMFIRENHDRPFFLYYAINMPHYPLQPRDEWREYYKELDMPRRDYAGFVSSADQNIGNILDLLDQLEIRENTIIVFLSDHGHSFETRAFGGGGSAGPLRGGKMSLFDGGIRVPAIISYPGHIPAGEIRNQVIHSTDIMPTLLSLCNIEIPGIMLEGIDVAQAIINDSDLPERSLFWKMGTQWAVMRDHWKLVGHPRDPSGKSILDPVRDELFLSYMLTDSTESNNIRDKHPEKVESLIREYFTWKNSDTIDLPDFFK
jgi:arylsulfatase A